MLAKIRAATAEDNGFTLVELLVVIAILGVLAGVAVFSVAGVQDDSQISACKTEASTVRTAEEAYFAKQKSYTDAAGLVTAKLIHRAPTMVTISNTGTAPAYTGYALTYVAATCAGAGTA